MRRDEMMSITEKSLFKQGQYSSFSLLHRRYHVLGYLMIGFFDKNEKNVKLLE